MTDTMTKARLAIAEATDQGRLDAIMARARKLVDSFELMDDDLDELARLATQRAESFAASSSGGDDREIVDEGEQVMEVVAYSYGTVTWKVNEKNPDGLCHRFRLRQGRKKFIFEDLPGTLSNIVRDLEVALGCPLGEQVVGRELRCVVKHITTRSGERRAVVGRWVLPRKQAAKAPAKAVEAGLPAGDDLPF